MGLDIKNYSNREKVITKHCQFTRCEKKGQMIGCTILTEGDPVQNPEAHLNLKEMEILGYLRKNGFCIALFEFMELNIKLAQRVGCYELNFCKLLKEDRI